MSRYDTRHPDFSELVGKTLKSVKLENAVLFLETDDGALYTQQYYEDCCAGCGLIDGLDDLVKLIGQKIVVVAEETTSRDMPSDYKPDYEPESFTWTFYTIRTFEGTAVLRWYGSSNGYYSETATFECVREPGAAQVAA